MTRLFLAAGVAALAIATPLAAKPGGGGGGDHGNGGGPPAAPGGGHGNGGGAPAAAPGGGGGGGRGHGNGGGGGAPAAVMGGGGGGGHGHGGGAAPVFMGGGGGRGHGGGFAAPQAQRVGGQQARNFQRQQVRGPERQQARNVQRQQARDVQRPQARGPARRQASNFDRQQMRGNRVQQAQSRAFDRQSVRGNATQQVQQQAFSRQQPNAAGLSSAVNFRGKDKQFAKQQQAFQQQLNGSRFGNLNYGAGTQILAPAVVERFVGVPVANVPSFASFSPMPTTLDYLYPATPDYYYQYGNGYAYQIDRSTSLIDALIPLLAGGYFPGQYLPASYMNSYVPDYYGLNSFYPDTPYGCNRYYNGVVYQVDCASGYVENVVPTYAGGYGVGQLLPSAYNYYNVPTQYRSMYYDTPDTGYWYAPGAIYQYDQGSSMITSVASLLSPGFSIGQQLPMGYGAYNVPYDYRQTYYDTPNASYRYNNGYIYQVDPTTQLVTAIVASLLT